MEFETKIRLVNQSVNITIPIQLARWLEAEEGKILCLQDEEGKKGKYITAWVKEE